MHTSGWMHIKIAHILNHGADFAKFLFFCLEDPKTSSPSKCKIYEI
jgi:hypothetical protein